MKVAYLVNRYPSVSHSFIRREIQALERYGVEVLRIALRGWTGQLPDGADEVERLAVRYVLKGGMLPLVGALVSAALRHPRRWIRALLLAARCARRGDRPLPLHLVYLAEACRVASWLDEHQVDHLHAHFGTNSAEVAMLAAELTGCRWSFTVHGPEEFDRPAAIKLAEKIRRAALVIAISSYGRAQLYRLVTADQWSKIHVVHCGLEQDYFLRLPVQRDQGIASRRLACIGRLSEQKGQLLLVEAVRSLIANGQEVELVLGGDGEMRGAVEKAIADAGLTTSITITGWLTGEQVRREILRCRALVLPSFAEGLPVVLMEAMALGRPVISTYIAGIPELVVHGASGWLVPAGDVEALAAAMKDCLARGEDNLSAMGRAAQEQCRARHRIDAEAEKLAQLFRAVGGRSGRGI
jgi:colanic acid/amylovoran biosynthesis glycosyltransferase